MSRKITRVLIKPPEKIGIKVRVPGSKSITNRTLIVSALAKGISIIKNASFSDDSNYLCEALTKLGIEITKGKSHIKITGGNIINRDRYHFLGNAGTAIRFLTSFLALHKGRFIVDGDERMRQRPIQPLVDAINKLGGDLRCNGSPPVTINAKGLIGGNIKIDGNISSQFISSLLMAAPYTKNGVKIIIKGKATSKPYIDMTIDVMNGFGVEVKRIGYNKFNIKPQRYKSARFAVSSDPASANYFFAIAAITGGRARVENIKMQTGELQFVNALKKMGATIKKGKEYIEVIGKSDIRGIEIDMNEMPDSVQTLGVVALFARGITRIRNVANLRFKETDRIKALCTELRKLGAKVKEFKDGLEIKPADFYKPCQIETYNDHRMAMSFAVAATRIKWLIIRNPACVSKSFPEFFSLLKAGGFEVRFN